MTLAALVLAVVATVTGGFHVTVAGLRISLHDPWRLLLLSLIAGSALAWSPQDTRRELESWWGGLERLSPWIAAAAAVALFVVGILHGTFTAAGADAHGYVSQAFLWAQGQIHVLEPLALEFPWPNPEWTLSPLGYRPATYPGAIVPTYAPGLPLMMTAALRLAGPEAVYFVVPLLGAWAVVSAYRLGRVVQGHVTGMMAAVVLAASPVVLCHVLHPMSDVPAAALWLAVLVSATQDHRLTPLHAGLLASLGVLTRPNLAPLVAPVAVFLMWKGHGERRHGAIEALGLFAVGLLPGVLLTGWIHQALYGSPLRSGYGSFEDIYKWKFLGRNLQLYTGWAIETHTVFLLLAAGAPFLLRRAPDEHRPRRVVALLLAEAGTLFLCYVFYRPFESWTYLRFLILGLAVLLTLSAAVTVTVVRKLPAAVRTPVVLVVTSLLASLLVRTATDRRVFADVPRERRYVGVAAFVERVLPRGALLLSMQHSGSLRHYAGRKTMRWDLLDPEHLDPAVELLRKKGYVPYLVLDAWEEPKFRKRFSRRSTLGRLDWPPRADIGQSPRVRVYDPADRRRYLAGEVIDSERIP